MPGEEPRGGVNATFRVLCRDTRRHPLHLWLALNDGVADGHDVSWIWDCDFEWLHRCVAAVTCSGRRAHELALPTANTPNGVDPSMSTRISTRRSRRRCAVRRMG